MAEDFSDSNYYPFVQYANQSKDTWLAYTPKDHYGQRVVHIISAPSAPIARKVLRANEGDRAKNFTIKAIGDAISDLVKLFEEGYNSRTHQLKSQKYE